MKKALVWSQPDSEVSSPKFSPDGNFVVLVTRVHWPDGDEAEGLPESFFTGLERRKQENPRFADPVVKVIDLNGRTMCEASYGQNPSLSADNNSIAFSRQKNPITGLRPLAETLAGNDIQVFDCAKNEARTVAEPGTGYLDDPLFLPDGKSIVYTRNEAVNGAMGGPVGVEKVDLTTGQTAPLLSKEVAPAVPCAGAALKPGFQTFICSQKVKLSESFSDLILYFGLLDDQVVVLQGRPMPSAGDMYMSSKYDLQLLTLLPTPRSVLQLGQLKTMQLHDLALQPLSDGRVMVFTESWKQFSLAAGTWSSEVGPRNANRRSVYSPDGKYYVATEPRDEPSQFVIVRTSDGQRLINSPKLQAVYDATWSRDSKHLAVVSVPNGTSPSAYKEELAVYSLP